MGDPAAAGGTDTAADANALSGDAGTQASGQVDAAPAPASSEDPARSPAPNEDPAPASASNKDAVPAPASSEDPATAPASNEDPATAPASNEDPATAPAANEDSQSVSSRSEGRRHSSSSSSSSASDGCEVASASSESANKEAANLPASWCGEDEQTRQQDEAEGEKGLKDSSFHHRQAEYSRMRENVKTVDVNMEALVNRWKRVREEFLRLRANSVLTSGNDGSLLIERRLTEVGSMCSTSTKAEFYISTLPKRIQAAVGRVCGLSAEEFTRLRRQSWRPYDRMLFACRMARTVAQACLVRRRLVAGKRTEDRLMSEKDVIACAIGKNVRDCMTYRPRMRTKDIRQKILWYLRTSKAFSHIFSAEMEEECTKFVFYEKYQDGRVLCLEGSRPEKFYCVIGGQIVQRKTYQLRTGDINPAFSAIVKGQTSSLEDVELQRPRKFTWSASGVTEVLTLERDAFLHLLRGTGGLPLHFLQTINIFQEFPCDKFDDHPDAIFTRYFPKDRIILMDISDTQWIHVVKSGSARVVRRQLVYDNSQNKYAAQREVGYSRGPSHGSDMLGLPHRQRRRKMADGHLPPIGSNQNPFSFTIGVCEPAQGAEDKEEEEEEEEEEKEVEEKKEEKKEEEEAAASGRRSRSSECSANQRQPGGHRLRRPVNLAARELRVPTHSAASLGRSWRLCSRQQAARVLLGAAACPPQRQQRETFVVVDCLRSGDFVGFQNITALIENERQTKLQDKEEQLILISDGVEMILVSKRFFVQHAANNTMLKAEMMSREFATPEDASRSMDAKEDWQMFKAAYIRRMAERTARQ